MKHPFKGAVRKVAAVSVIALAASVVPVSMSSAAKVQAPKQGGDITVGIFNQLLTTCFSPNAANSALGVMKTVYEGLVEQRSDGRVVPHLAQSISPSADYKTWTIKLRSGIKYHDGSSMTVANVIANIQALRGFYYFGAVARGQGAAVIHTLGSGVPLTSNIKDVRAVSADTVAVDLWNPQVDYPEWLYASGRFFMRADSDLQNRTQCLTSGKGTGPFKFERHSPTEIKVVRNPDYWRKDKAGVQLPYLNSITFKYVAQSAQRANGLRSGTLDAAGFTSAGEIKQIVSVQADRKLKTILSADEYYAMNVLNHAIEPFNNKNARLAVAHAFDMQTYYKQRNCYKGKCIGTIPTSIVGRLNIGYNTAGYIKYDLAKAKRFAAAYKAETGKDLAFNIPVDVSADAQASAKSLAQIMKKAGITVNIQTEDTATITAKAFPSPGNPPNPYQMYPTVLFEGRGVSFTFPFVQSNVYRAPNNLGAAAIPQLLAFGVGLNPSRFSDPALDNLVWAAQFDTTKARAAKVKAVTKYLQENASVLSVPTTQYLYGFNANLKGFDTFVLASGGRGRPMTNAGVNWTGVYLEK